jgi:uncharacterized membrane protein
MDKRGYLCELEKALNSVDVKDTADILEEYSEHFNMKSQDGYSEEETAAKLALPKEIAEQFASIKPGNGVEKGSKFILSVGLVFADIFAAPIFLSLYLWVLALGVFSIVAAGLGTLVVTQTALWDLIPPMPNLSAFFAGLALLALAVLSAIGTEYCRKYITQLIKVYIRWHKAVLGDSGRISPPLPMHPQIKPKKLRIMRNIVLSSIIVCAICCIAWYVSMAITTGAFEPWHALHWFE